MCRVEERWVVGVGCKGEMIDVVGNWGEKKSEGLKREEEWGSGWEKKKGGVGEQRIGFAQQIQVNAKLDEYKYENKLLF